MWSRTALVSILCVVAAACTRGSGDRPSRPQAADESTARRNPYLIERAELRATAAPSLYDAIIMRRPTWFTRASSTAPGNDAVAVYIGEQLAGPLSMLRQMSVDAAQSVRYLTPTEANLRYGAKHGSRAAIVIEYARQ